MICLSPFKHAVISMYQWQTLSSGSDTIFSREGRLFKSLLVHPCITPYYRLTFYPFLNPPAPVVSRDVLSGFEFFFVV